MKPLLFLLLLSVFSIGGSSLSLLQSGDHGFISAFISEKGLDFVKDLLVEQELKDLVPLEIPKIEKSVKIPLIGVVDVAVTDLTLSELDVNSSAVRPGDGGVVIVASGATANLSFDWRYSYSTWLVPLEISDEGSAFVQVEDMEVGLNITIKNQNGTLALEVMECGCYMKDLSITLKGGASWFYQGFVNAFEDHIRSAVEKAITKKIGEGTLKLDQLLQALPKEINVYDNVAINVTCVDDPVFGNSSVEIDINGLFILSDKAVLLNKLHGNPLTSVSCLGPTKMLGISLDEAVFTSASVTYFESGLMHWFVDKIPDQSLLNTASWKFIIPQMYRKYPNDDMDLNFTITSPPVIKINPEGIDAAITADMTVNVLDASGRTSVACISVDIAASGVVEISGNSIAGRANLNDFTLDLKWSKVGNFHTSLIQGVMRVFLNTVFMPYINSRLRKGFPLPIIHGYTLQDAYILTASSKIDICSDVVLTNSSSLANSPLAEYYLFRGIQ